MISVIIPVFNTEAYIARCLDSVLKQTAVDLEILCVNDCSTDHSLEILQQYAQTDSRISLVDLPENEGVSHARNLAIEMAKGKFIYFLDSDDWIDSGFLERMLLEMERHGTDIVLNASFINEYDQKEKNTCGGFGFIPPEGRLFPANELQLRYPPVIWSRLYLRSFLVRQGIRFPSVNAAGGDVYFAYAADLIAGSVFAFRDRESYHYYQRPISLRNTLSRGFHYIESFCLLKSFLDSRQVTTEGVKLFYVESLILDTEQKYDFVKAYLVSIRDQVERNRELYNAQEHFLMSVMEETGSYAEYVSRYNPNVALSFIRYQFMNRS